MDVKIAYIESVSLIEYPGNISSIIYTYGCNLRCKYCFNPDLINYKNNCLKIKDVLNTINHYKHLIDGVVITGGEPTIYNDLYNFCKSIKNKHLLVKINTNGILCDKIKNLIEIVDYFSIDFKGTKDIYREVVQNESVYDNVIESIKILSESQKKFSIHTTIYKPYFNEEILKEIANTLNNLVKNPTYWYLQEFKENIEYLHEDAKKYKKLILKNKFLEELSSKFKNLIIGGLKLWES